jgi:hypothetical protein
MLVALTENSDLFKVYGKVDSNEISIFVLSVGLADEGFIEIDASVFGFILNCTL